MGNMFRREGGRGETKTMKMDRKKKYSHAKEKTEENRRKKQRPRQSKRDEKKGGMTNKNVNNEGKVEIEKGEEKKKRRE